MNQNYRPQDGWKSFSDPQQPEVDPYERGFADKLYEDGYEPDYTADGAQQEAWQEQPRQAEPGRRDSRAAARMTTAIILRMTHAIRSRAADPPRRPARGEGSRVSPRPCRKPAEKNAAAR